MTLLQPYATKPWPVLLLLLLLASLMQGCTAESSMAYLESQLKEPIKNGEVEALTVKVYDPVANSWKVYSPSENINFHKGYLSFYGTEGSAEEGRAFFTFNMERMTHYEAVESKTQEKVVFTVYIQ